MADTFDTWLKIRLIETGAYNNTWGAVLNADALAALAKGVAGRSDILLTGLTYSLPALANGADSDSRAAILRFTGSPAGPVTVTVPGSVTSRVYAIDNQCGQTITLTYSGSTTTTSVAAGIRAFALCDGTNVYPFGGGATNADTLGGVAAASYARRDISNVFLGVNSYPWETVTEAPNVVIDATAGNHQRLTLTADRAMSAATGAVDGQMLMLQVVQDAVGGRGITAWHSSFRFENGTAPVMAVAANAIDLFLMIYDASLSSWLVAHFGPISATSSGGGYNLTIEGNQCDVNLAALLGSIPVASVVNLTIAQGTVLQALSEGSYALDLANVLPPGSILNMTNLGYIQGRGGRGGNGNGAHVSGSGNFGWSVGSTAGFPGGAAMRGPGSGVTWNLTNATGFIRGGGGGGGGGASSITANGGQGCGGGGGGGAGGGVGGQGGSVNNALRAGQGISGSTGTAGAAGSGGASATTGGATATAGGDGGGWGVAGDTAATDGFGGVGGAGGAAGKAIELGGGTVNFISGSGAPNVVGAVS